MSEEGYLKWDRELRPVRIAGQFNAEHIVIPQDYKVKRVGKQNSIKTYPLRRDVSVRKVLKNPVYIGSYAL